jgi:hypothetical protein
MQHNRSLAAKAFFFSSEDAIGMNMQQHVRKRALAKTHSKLAGRLGDQAT